MCAKFGIDIDDTLFHFGAEVREAFFEMAIDTGDKKYLRGAYSGFHEWRDLSDAFDWPTVSKAIEWVHDRQLNQVPYKNAARVCHCISVSHDIKYVTSRHEKHHDNTQKWLDINGFPKGELICTDHDKSGHLWDCQYLIDDRPKTIINFVKDYDWLDTEVDERKAFGIWTPFNRNLTDIDNIYLAPTWRGIEFYLQRKEVI